MDSEKLIEHVREYDFLYDFNNKNYHEAQNKDKIWREIAEKLNKTGIVKLVTGMTLYCSNMWWPSTSLGGFLNTCCFMSLSGLTLYNFMSSIFNGPGHVPPNWQPENPSDVLNLQWCAVCNAYKAPRSHHCRKCGKCVLKMDHHCPWINNCVGWGNHANFTYFLLFAVLGCSHASVVLGCSLYRGIHRTFYIYHGIRNVPIVQLNLYSVIMCVFALGLTIGVVLAVGMLLFFQIRAIYRNRTGIEDWILEKANHRRKSTRESPFVFPYDLGIWNNIKQVLTWSGEPTGNGIHWKVLPNCDQYTLTREQLEQKGEKRERTKLYNISRAASGSWFPITQGFSVCFNTPCTDEPRIKLNVGEKVLVTRWRKYWLFGKKVVEGGEEEEEEQAALPRGWFPRKCAVEYCGLDNLPQDKKLN